MVSKISVVPDTCPEVLEVVLIGANHKTAPVELREKLAFSDDEVKAAVDILGNDPLIREVILFSTCNRVEFLVVSDRAGEAVESVKNYISEYKNICHEDFSNALYTHSGDEAVRHIFRVASSLDSMIVGEPQILGQIKSSFVLASEKKSSGVILNRLLHRTFNVAKRVRTETGIGDNAVSISYAAIELGRKIFGTLENKKVLLVGAGEMAELAVEHLIRHRVGDILVANRTFERGVDLAERFNGKAIRFDEINDALKRVDIIISSTGAPGYVITPDLVKGAMKSRKRRPLFYIDIAVPRDIDPEINKLENSYVYDIDDLKGVIDDNIEERNREALKAERVIEEGVIRFRNWFENLGLVPTIVDLRSKISQIARDEIEKTLVSLKSVTESDQEAIHRMAESLVSKVLHDPILFLKKTGHHNNEQMYINITRTMFKLDE